MEIKLEDSLILDETKPKPKKGRKKGSKNRPLSLRKPKKNRTAHPPPIELDEPIECDVCNQTYKNNVAFALHSIEHSKDRRFSCHLCDFKNTSKYHIEMHVRAHEGTTKYKCEICNKAFTVSTNAHEHKYFHTGEKPFRCEICGKHFMYSRFLASHRRTQHYEIITGTPLVKYDCKICNKHYTSSSGLRRHNLRNHNTEGIDTTVLCDTCGKRISSKEKLKFHMRIHTGYKPFSCEVCGKAFSEKERLKEHMRVHTGEKPFMCKFCGKAFTQRSPLKIHERTHTGEQPYICRLCGRGHVSKSSMDAHMKSCSALQIPSSNPGPQHLQEPYTCNIGMCNKIFGSKAALEGHLPCHMLQSYDIFDDKDERMQEVLERKQFAASLNELAERRDFSNNMVFGKQEGLRGEAQDFTQKREVRGEAYEQGVGQLKTNQFASFTDEDLKLDIKDEGVLSSLLQSSSSELPELILRKSLKVRSKKGNKPRVKSEKKRIRKHPPPIELDEPIECEVCNSTYRNNVAFALHTIRHSEENKYSCHLCPYKNISKYHIEMHVRAHEGTTKFKCEICQKAFTVSTHAVEHKYYHTGEKPFQCEICGKHFMFSRFLAAHRRSQHYEILTGSPLVKFDCKVCNKHYASASGLRRHKLSKHNDEGVDLSVLCDICGKRLSSREKLKFHRRIHTGYKPFSCQVCNKAFTKKDQLIEHVRVHTGEKPHICKYCGRGFTQRTPKKIHERTHSGERPYVCSCCGKGFLTKTSVDSHMKTCGGNVMSAFASTWMGHPLPQLSQLSSLSQLGQMTQIGQPHKYFPL